MWYTSVMMPERESTRKTLAAVFALLLVACVFVVVRAHAADSISTLTDDQKEAIEDREDEIKKINDKIKAYQKIIDLKQAQGATLQDQIEALEAQASKLELEIRSAEQRLSDVSSQLDDINGQVSEKVRIIARERLVLSELVREYHAGSDDGSGILLASSGEDGYGFFSGRDDWMVQTNDRIVSILRDLADTKKSLEGEQDLLTRKKIEADSLKSQLDQKNSELSDAQKNKQVLLAKTQTEQTKYSNLVDNLEEQRKAIEDEIESLESGLSVGSDVPSANRGLLAYPLKNPEISQGYGKTAFAKKAYASGMHNGIDFSVDSGTTVMAAAAGKIVGTGNAGKYAYGKWIAIDHGNGLITLYGHLSSHGVSKGQKVTKGQKIGLSGNTGYSTGPHLHFSVFSASSYKVVESTKVNGVYYPIGASVNPMSYLP
ncbi:MAG: peptidoglycan DD-metalloendopeptidase family protein [Candidatus Moranbacteria bacterium]|nr:peptidoglycan DD-metalloendopeptidase family protein [Candidatus Moranbacteria bacterium]